MWLAVTGAIAAPRDKAAEKKIQEAIFTHFLNTDFDAAEGLLLGTIRACADQCSPAIVARAWMYVGVVRGTGRGDLSGAEDAFGKALSADPKVDLDRQIANDPVKALFDKKRGRGTTVTRTPPPKTTAGLTCVPAVSEVAVRRAIPLQCEADADLDSASLHYKTFSGGWKSVPMSAQEGAFRGTIPCAATQSTGTLRYYVEGRAEGGKIVASEGSKSAPKEIEVSSETSAEPPAFPGEEPPARCGIEAAEAEHKEGCGAWGGKCGDDGCCDDGLSCVKGTCESGECKEDSDCSGGRSCVSGRCEGEESGGSGVFAKNVIGLHFGFDTALVSVENGCAPGARDDHVACFEGSRSYPNTANPNAAGTIPAGFVPATMRVLASYERLFGAVGLEARLGFAFNGGPTPSGGAAFLPIHAEARAKWWLLGAQAFESPGLRPWVHLGGGVAQVNATTPDVQVADCTGAADPGACMAAPDLRSAYLAGARIRTVDVMKQLGTVFIGAGGGLMYAVGKSHGVVLNLNAMLMLPSSGLVLEPSLGYAAGF